MDDKGKLQKVIEVFKSFPEVRLAYLFGSRAAGTARALSDYDFAVFFDEAGAPEEMFQGKLALMGKLDEALKTDDTDVVVLNFEGNPVLKYHVIKYGKMIFERDAYRMIVEPRILSEYFDFKAKISKHNLARVK